MDSAQLLEKFLSSTWIEMEPARLAEEYSASQLERMAGYAVARIERSSMLDKTAERWERALDNIIDALDLQKRAVA